MTRLAPLVGYILIKVRRLLVQGTSRSQAVRMLRHKVGGADGKSPATNKLRQLR
jgi:hypothetical protein